MSDGGRYAGSTTEVHCHRTAVTQGKLDSPLALLAGDTPCDGAVDLVGEPVLTCDTFLLEDCIEVALDLLCVVRERSMLALHMLIDHIGLRC